MASEVPGKMQVKLKRGNEETKGEKQRIELGAETLRLLKCSRKTGLDKVSGHIIKAAFIIT